MSTPEPPVPPSGDHEQPTAEPDDLPYVPVSPLLSEDPPKVSDFWLDARLVATPAGVAFTAHDDEGRSAVLILLSEGATADAAARDRMAGVVNAMHIDAVLARGGHGQDSGRLGRKFRSDADGPVAPDDRLVAPWAALAWDGSPEVVAAASRVLDEVQIASLPPQGAASGPDYQHYWVDRVRPGLARLWPLPWPGRYDRAGWRTILVSWLLMMLLAALAVLIAILIFRNQPPQTPPPPTGVGQPAAGLQLTGAAVGVPVAAVGVAFAAVGVTLTLGFRLTVEVEVEAGVGLTVTITLGLRVGLPVAFSVRQRARRRAAHSRPERFAQRQPVASVEALVVIVASSSGAAAPPVPQLVVTDLDGTFLSPDGTVSEENRQAVLAAQAAGIPVLFATGRPVRWLDVIRDLPGAHPTVIASNGAVLYDLGADTMLDRICLDPQVALAAVRAIRSALPSASFAVESGTRFGHDPSYQLLRRVRDLDPAIFSAPADELAAREDCVKMLVQDLSRSADELLAAVLDVVGDTLTVTHSVTTGSGLVEISGPGVSKASMLQRCCRRLGIGSARVAAFGDMPNDVEMLSWAGMPHVVANAHPALLSAPYTVVPGNDRSGVGRTIAAWAAAVDAAPLPLPTP